MTTEDWESRCLRQEVTIERLRRQVAEAQRDAAIAQKNEAVMRNALEPVKRRLAAFEAKTAERERIFNGGSNGQGQ